MSTKLSRDALASKDYKITKTVGFGALAIEYLLSRDQSLYGTLGLFVDDSRKVWAFDPGGYFTQYSVGNRNPSRFEWSVAPFVRAPITWEPGAEPGKPVYENNFDSRMPRFTYSHVSLPSAEKVFGKPFTIHEVYMPFLNAILVAKQLYVIANYDLMLTVSQDGVLTPDIEYTKKQLFQRLDELWRERTEDFQGITINYRGLHRHPCYQIELGIRSKTPEIFNSLQRSGAIPPGKWSVNLRTREVAEYAEGSKIGDPPIRKLPERQADLVFSTIKDAQRQRLAECGGIELPGFIFELNWPKITECHLPTPVSLEREDTKLRCNSENLGGITFDLEAKEMLVGSRKWYSRDTIEGVRMELAEAVTVTSTESNFTQKESSKERSRKSNAVVTPITPR